MEHNLENTLAILARTPATFDALLRGLPEAWTRAKKGEETWNAFDIVAHLIHGERTDWMPRVRIILQSGDSTEFEPYDRWGHLREAQGKQMVELLDEFARLRQENLVELRALNLQPEDLVRRARHPAFGVVTLGQMLATWATHDLRHLAQLFGLLAHRYEKAVGPWREYLGVLKCAGHNSP